MTERILKVKLSSMQIIGLVRVSLPFIGCVVLLRYLCYLLINVLFLFSDCKFMMFPPSMIAAGSIGAATHGLNNTLPHLDVKLLQRLHQITGIEMVSDDTFCLFHLFSLLFTTIWWIDQVP